ncbi:non-structural maintenance of chromosomes element 4 homolog A-like [Clavelina lepadiformis]|uniref:Non-structural maintenance of chromosomes element 4 n=1 Tax=Clavelina lepadiformis TaxID=159417 RepID=A0ABP0GGT9_CLALP
MSKDSEEDDDFGNSVLDEDTPQSEISQHLSKTERLNLRRSYRKLIEETQQNKEELIKPDNNGLMENIAKAQELFKKVKGPTEGALDSRFMSLAVSLGAQKTSLLQTDLVAFQPDEFIQKLVTFMEGNVTSDNPEDVFIPDRGWEMLGENTTQYFTSIVPALHPLAGVFEDVGQSRGPTPSKVRRFNEETNARTQLPQHLTNYRADQKEATPEEIERVLKIIRGFYASDPSPFDYFELVVNPQSFGHTIENIFHLAFLVKDGLVRVFLGENGIPVVEPVKDAEAQKSKKNLKEDDICNQVMVSLSMDEWEAIIDAYQLAGAEPSIPAGGARASRKKVK